MAGSRTWASLYQGRPSPESGDLFLREQWQRYDQPLWLVRDDGARIVPGLDVLTRDVEHGSGGSA